MLNLGLSTARSNTTDNLFVRILAEEGRCRFALGTLLVRVSFILGNHNLGAGRELIRTVVHPACAARVTVETAVAALLAGTGCVVSGLVTADLGAHPGEVFDEGAGVGALLG